MFSKYKNKKDKPMHIDKPFGKASSAAIITIGDELLIGQIVDTNSAWMAGELNNAGFPVGKIISIHDEEPQILSTLDEALAENDIVLITGGLGPTKDDITKLALCHYFDTSLVFDESVYQNIESLYKHRPSVMNELTRLQAMVPEKCTVIQNAVGTAPIMWFEHEGKVVVSMPGVPFEMKTAMIEEIIPRLKDAFRVENIVHKTLQVYGYGESALALKISDWEDALPEYLHLAYLPSFGVVRLRLSGMHTDRELLENEVASQFEKLGAILGDSIVATYDLPVENTLVEMLRKKSLTLSAAESCTGGNISRRITLISGSSAVFKGSVVAYNDNVKTNLLQVPEKVLSEFGAVSRQVVEQMAAAIQKITGSNFAIGVSGIAGPTGGTAEKPVGTVWIALKNGANTVSKLFHFGSFPRETIIERTTTAALMMALEAVRGYTNAEKQD